MSASVIALNANAGGFIALRAYQHNIRDVNWSFKFDPARVHIASCLGLHLLLVLNADVDTLHHHATLTD
jgi:hypothetical protein